MWPLLAAAGKALAAKGAGSAAAGAAAKGGAAVAAKGAAAAGASAVASQAAPAAAGVSGGVSVGAGASLPAGGGATGGSVLKPQTVSPKPSLKPQIGPPGTPIPPMPGGGAGSSPMPMETVLPESAVPNTRPTPPTAAQQVGFFDNLLESTTKGIGRTLGVDNVSPVELLTSQGRSGLMRGAAVNQFDNLLGGRLTTGLRSMGLPDSMNAGDVFRLMSAQQQQRQRRQP